MQIWQQLLQREPRLVWHFLISNNFVNVTIIMLCNYFFAEVIDFGGAICAALNVTSSVPHGGLFALPGFNYPQYWMLALLVGSCVFAVLLQFLKRKPVEQDASEEKDIDLSDLKIS